VEKYGPLGIRTLNIQFLGVFHKVVSIFQE
jgi:hypothetical protein